MKKAEEVKVNKISIKTGTNKSLFTMRFIIFDPKKHFVSTPEAKDLCRKDMHCSKKKMADEYDSLFGVWIKVGRGKNTHIEFNKTTKSAANVIFIVPKKYRREAWETIKFTEIPMDFFKIALK